MMKIRFSLTLNCLLLISLILTSCGGAPTLPNFIAPAPTQTAVTASTAVQQAYPPALIETDPPLNTVIGHLSPITFYFNQSMDKASVEAVIGGLPAGTFTWTDDATLVGDLMSSLQEHLMILDLDQSPHNSDQWHIRLDPKLPPQIPTNLSRLRQRSKIKS